MNSQPEHTAPEPTEHDPGAPSDADLISAVRAGNLEAYGTLFARHADAARRLARHLASASDVDDLVAEAFSKVLGALQRGGGPDLAFRAYLLTAVRRLHVDTMRSGARFITTDDLAPDDAAPAVEDTIVNQFEGATVAKAFASLPERWQLVLWHTEVECQKPADIAPLLGMSANSVSALAYRAREGLRQAFVTLHANAAVDELCATVRAELGSYIRGGTSRRTSNKIEEHLSRCRECAAIFIELAEVNSHLGAILAPMLLGTAGAGYLTAATKGAVVGFGPHLWKTKAGRTAVLTSIAAALAAAVALAMTATSGTHAPAAPPPTSRVAPVVALSAPSGVSSRAKPPRHSRSPLPTRSTAPTPIAAPPSRPPVGPSPATRPTNVRSPPPVTRPSAGDVTLDLRIGLLDSVEGLVVVKVDAAHGRVRGTITVTLP